MAVLGSTPLVCLPVVFFRHAWTLEGALVPHCGVQLLTFAKQSVKGLSYSGLCSPSSTSWVVSLSPMFVPLRIPAVSAGGGGVPVELGPTPCQLPDPEHAADIGEPLRASAGYAGPRFLQALGRKVQDRGLRLDQLRYELHCVRAGAQCQEQTIALLDRLRLPFGRLQSQRIDALVSQALSVRPAPYARGQ